MFNELFIEYVVSKRQALVNTVILSNGALVETVSKILAHTKVTTTQIYAKVVESKLNEDT